MIRDVACPYCYRRITAGQLWFRCTGRGAPGRVGCAVTVDERRRIETGFAERTRPSFMPARTGPFAPRQMMCPQCGGETTIRVCPHCHSPLAFTYGSSRSPLIAMVGAKGTGKTVYLTVLAHELLTGLRSRFDADVRFAGDLEKGQEAPDWLRGMLQNMYRQHELAPTTEGTANGRREPVVFEWRRARRCPGLVEWYPTSFLSFYDTAGEDLSNTRTSSDLTYLGAADALILLLDPFKLPRTRDRVDLPVSAMTSTESTVDVVSRVTKRLRDGRGTSMARKIDIPVAVAFAKLDVFFDFLGPAHPLLHTSPSGAHYDESFGRMTHEHVRGLLHDLGGEDIDRFLRYHYRSFRYFGISSLGAPPDYDANTVGPGGIRPHRIEEPLIWLLSQFGVVPR